MNEETSKMFGKLLKKSLEINNEILSMKITTSTDIDLIIEKIKEMDAIDAKIYELPIGFWKKRKWQHFHKTNMIALTVFLGEKYKR